METYIFVFMFLLSSTNVISQSAEKWELDWSTIKLPVTHQIPFKNIYASTPADACPKGSKGNGLPLGYHQETFPEITTLDYFPEPEVFYRDFIRKSRPLLVRGGTKDWPAMKLWPNLTYYKEAFGDDWMQVQFKKIYDKYHQFYAPMKMKDFVDLLEKKEKSVYLDATVSPYMTEQMLWPKYLHCDSLLKMLKQVALFFNNGGTSSDIHMDVTETFMTQVRGTRQWLLMSPASVRYLYISHNPYHRGSSPVNQTNVDILRYPHVSKLTVYNVTVQEGDIIYVPEGWFHQVNAYPAGEPNIAIAIFVNFLNCNKKVRNLPDRYDDDVVYIKMCEQWREMQPEEIKCSFPSRLNEPMNETVHKYHHLQPDAFTALRKNYRTDPGYPEITNLKNGDRVPMIGYRISGNEEEAATNVYKAVQVGYRLFETSVDNPVASQRALSRVMKKHKNTLFVTVPLHPKYLGYNSTKNFILQSLQNLSPKRRINLAVLMAPSCHDDFFPCTSQEAADAGSWEESWRAMEDLQLEGKIISLGLGHFSVEQIQIIQNNARVNVSAVIGEFNPVRQNRELRQFCKENNIVFMGHSILGTQLVKQYETVKRNPVLYSEVTHLLSYRYRACPAAIVLKWAMMNDVVSLFHTRDHWHLLFDWQAHMVDIMDDPHLITRLNILNNSPHAGDIVTDESALKNVRHIKFGML